MMNNMQNSVQLFQIDAEISATNLERYVWPTEGHREDLPCLKVPRPPSVMSLFTKGLKEQLSPNAVQQELHKEIFPIGTHEPLTELQRRLEGVQNAYLLNEAVRLAPGSTERLVKVASFHVAYWAASGTRSKCKALRPLPGETFDIVNARLGIVALAENVETAAHGPYRSVCQIWGQAWTMQFESFVNVENRGLGVNFQSNHAAELKFIDGDTYHMIMPPGHISVRTGAFKFTHSGSALVQQIETGCTCEIDLREPSIFSTDKAHQIKGCVKSKDGQRNTQYKLSGTWDKAIGVYCNLGTREEFVLLWEAPPLQTNNGYNLGKFAVQLNHRTSLLRKIVPKTDSRLRADIQALEEGRHHQAEDLRAKLINKAGKRCENGDLEIHSRWFQQRHSPKQICTPGRILKYRYGGDYWRTRVELASHGFQD